MLRRAILSSILITSSLLFYVSCNKSSDSDSGGGTGISSLFKSAFPEEAAVASPTAQKSASGASLAIQGGPIVQFDAGDTADSKKKSLEAVLDGATADTCKVNINLYSSGNANCYGPSVTLSGTHPDGTIVTSGMGKNDVLPGGDLGLWSATESSEACASAQLNSRMKGVASQIDAAFFSVASMMCAARNAGSTLPAVGGSLDVTTAMNGKVTINNAAATITLATLSREANSGTKPVYVSVIEATVGTKTVSLRMKHIPAGEQDESTFTGKVSVKIFDTQVEAGFVGNCSGSSGGGIDAASVIYEKTSSGNMKYLLKTGNFCGSNANPFVSSSNYTVDLTRTYSSNNGGWGNNGNVLLADFAPSTGIGTYQYAWQAGRNDSHARVLNVKISDTSNAVAYFGFGPALSATSNVGSINTMICNWAGPGSTHTGVSKVQKQVLSRSSTVFTPSTSNIAYAPVNSCDHSAATSLTITPSGQSGYVASTIPTTLVNLTDYTSAITNVTAPSEIE